MPYSTDGIIIDGGVTGNTSNFNMYRGDGSQLINVPDTFVTGFTYNNANSLTISSNRGNITLTTQINSFTGLTINGNLTSATISGGTIYGNGANISNVGGGSLNQSTSTALVNGGVISINSANKFNISEGFGYWVDSITDPLNPVVMTVKWSGITGVTLVNLTSSTQSFIAMSSGATVIQSATPFSDVDVRNYIILGGVSHFNSTIDTVYTNPITITYPMNQYWDLATSIGIITKSGNVYSPNGTNMLLNKSAGSSFRIGGDYTSFDKSPNIINSTNLIAAPIIYFYRNGTNGFISVTASTVDPSKWDNGSGTLQTVPGGQDTTQRIFFNPSTNQTFIHYGQTLYTSLASAEGSIATEIFAQNPILDDNSAIRTFLLINSLTTDLTDLAKCKFVTAGKFGQVSAGASTSTTNLQQAYNNSSQPEIVTNTTNGALSLRVGSALNTDTVIEVHNLGGITTAYIQGNGGSLFNTIRLTSGATNGYILTSDSIGNSTWQPAPSGIDTFVTGFTYANNIFTISQNQGRPNLTATIPNFITGFTDNFVTGGTLNRSTNTLTLNRQNGSVIITGVTDTRITGFTYNNNNLITINQNEGFPNLNITINQMSGLTISNNLIVSATTSTQSLTIRGGAITGYILTSDSSGNALWQPSPVGSGATKLDSQSVTATATTTSTSTSATWVDVGSMTLTTKNLGNSATTYTVSFSCTAALSTNTGNGGIRLVFNDNPILHSERRTTNAGASMAASLREMSTIGVVSGVKNGDVIKVQTNSPVGQMTITNRTLLIMGVLNINLI